jgi:hypothetical protein
MSWNCNKEKNKDEYIGENKQVHEFLYKINYVFMVNLTALSIVHEV